MTTTINADNGVSSGSAGLKSSADSSGALQLQTNGTAALTIDTSQNVGIGTSSPVGAGVVLNIQGAASSSLVAGSTSNANFVSLYSGQTSDANPSVVFNNSLRFGTATSPNTTGYTERMRIDSSGNVGIGTSSPAFASGTGLQVERSGDSTVRVSRTGATASAGEFVASSGLVKIGATSGTPFTFITDNTERMRIDSSGYITNAVNGNGNGRVQGYQYYRLNAAYAGSNATGAQSLFGVGVTLVGSTVYEFEIVFVLAKTAGATNHTMGIGFGGTATVNNIHWQFTGIYSTITNNIGSAAAITAVYAATASNTTVTLVTNATTVNLWGVIKGTVSINAGGTFIPQYTLSAAPGGAYSTQIGSFIKISALSASGAATSIGTWA